MAPRRPNSSRSSPAVVYDPSAHREFVTGFRKRKQERRAQATKDIAANEKQARRDERKQKRAILKRTADRARGLTADSSDDDEGAEGGNAASRGGRGILSRNAKHKRTDVGEKQDRVSKVYDGANDAVVTTTVVPVQTYADAHFSSRLPRVRKLTPNMSSVKEKKAVVGAKGAGDGVAGESAPAVTRKRTKSSAKKLSKMHNHSRIQKIRRERRSAKAS